MPKGQLGPGLRRYQEERRQRKEAQKELEENLAGQTEEATQDIVRALPPEIGDLFLELKRASEAKDIAQALERLWDVMGKLSPEVVARVRESPAYQAIVARAEASKRERKPGEPIYDEKGEIKGYEPWRREDYADEEPVTFIGDENLIFYVNGVQWIVGAGIRTSLPASIYHYYMENRQERRRAESGDEAFAYLQSITGGRAIRS